MKFATKYIARQFAFPSGIGGRVATQLMNVFNRKMYITCLNLISDFSEQNTLDIGFGNGYMLSLLQKKNSNLYGIDISVDALKMAKEKLNKNVQLSIGAVESLNFRNDLFGVIYTINTFYFWYKPLLALSEIKRTLIDGGLFINFCYTKDWLSKLEYTKYKFSKMPSDDIVQLHIEAGFKSVELKIIKPNKSFYIICKK